MRGESVGDQEHYGECFRCTVCGSEDIACDGVYCPNCGSPTADDLEALPGVHYLETANDKGEVEKIPIDPRVTKHHRATCKKLAEHVKTLEEDNRNLRKKLDRRLLQAQMDGDLKDRMRKLARELYDSCAADMLASKDWYGDRV